MIDSKLIHFIQKQYGDNKKLAINFLNSSKKIKIVNIAPLDQDFFMYDAIVIKEILNFAKDNRVTLSNKNDIIAIISSIKDWQSVLIAKNKQENKKSNLAEYNKKKIILSSYPLELFVELTRNCNGWCIMCPRRHFDKEKLYDPRRNMSFDLFKNIADSLFPYAEYVDLRGFGESTILPDFLNYVKYALKFNCKLGLVTNFTIRNDYLWKFLFKNDFTLGISLDGATQTTYEKIRAGSKFSDLMHNLNLLSKFLEKNNTNSYISFMVTVQKDNIHEIAEIVKLAKQVGIKNVELNPINGCGEIRVEDSEIIASAVNRAMGIARKENINLAISGSLRGSGGTRINAQYKCSRPWSSAYITYDGGVGPCNHRITPPPLIFGNLNKDSFSRIWNNFNFQLFRKTIHTDLRFDKCNWCYNNRYY